MPEPLSLRDRRSGRPLRVLITRPDEQAEETAELVRAAGGVPLVFPCLHRAPPADPQAFVEALCRPGGYDVVAIASANTAIAVGEALRQLSPPVATELRRATFAAVGPRTAAALFQQGITAGIIASDESTGDGLFAAIESMLKPLAGKRVLVPRAAVARAALVDSLRRAGVEVVETVAYEMAPASANTLSQLATLLRSREVDLLPFGSPRTAAIALSALQNFDDGAALACLSRVVIGAIGPTTEAALREAGVRVDVVAQPATFEALLRRMQVFYDEAPRVDSLDVSDAAH